MSLSRMLAKFQQMGYPPASLINQQAFYMILDQMLGSPFDREVGREIWQQADIHSNDQTEVQRLCEVIQDAQNILRGKIHQTSQRIQRLRQQRNIIASDFHLSGQQRANQLADLEREVNDLQRDTVEFKEDLHFITAPFDIDKSHAVQIPPFIPRPATAELKSNLFSHVGSSYNSPGYHPSNIKTGQIDSAVAALAMKASVSKVIPQYNSASGSSFHGVRYEHPHTLPPPKPGPNNQLMYIFWITVVVCLFEIVMMFKKYNFLNLLVICCIMSIFLLNYFDRNYVKVCIGLTGLNMFIDLIWLFLYARAYWSPPRIGEFATSEADYLRLIVVFTVMTMALKVPLMMMLFRHKDISLESNYVVDMGRMHIYSNKRNLISQAVAEVAQPFNILQ